MKKALVVVLALVMTLSVVGLVSCAGKTYEGEYSYVNSRNEKQKYGCRVKVTLQGDVITNVEVLEDTADFFNLSAGWTNNYQESGVDTEGKTNWRKYGQAMADSFVGLTKKKVLAMKVYVNKVVNAGEPITGNSQVETIKYIPEELAVVMGGHGEIAKGAGATQSSARLILAVQDALLQAGGDASKNPNCIALDPGQTVTGECHYNKYNNEYGAKVDVTVKDGKITAVKLYTDEESGYVRTSAGWTEVTKEEVEADPEHKVFQLGHDKAEAAYEGWIKSVFVGKTVEEVKAYVATATVDNQSVGTEAVKLTGATQSSARIIVAVQNALSKLK